MTWFTGIIDKNVCYKVVNYNSFIDKGVIDNRVIDKGIVKKVSWTMMSFNMALLEKLRL